VAVSAHPPDEPDEPDEPLEPEVAFTLQLVTFVFPDGQFIVLAPHDATFVPLVQLVSDVQSHRSRSALAQQVLPVHEVACAPLLKSHAHDAATTHCTAVHEQDAASLGQPLSAQQTEPETLAAAHVTSFGLSESLK
jgi:hypothetical protein